MRYFLDTSALVKIYHKEEGSENVLDVYKRENMNISELSIVEFLSTVYRKYREKEIDELTLNAIWSKFNEDLETRYDVIPFSSIIIDKACNLIHKHGGSKSLRTLDSLQLTFFLIYFLFQLFLMMELFFPLKKSLVAIDKKIFFYALIRDSWKLH